MTEHWNTDSQLDTLTDFNPPVTSFLYSLIIHGFKTSVNPVLHSTIALFGTIPRKGKYHFRYPWVTFPNPSLRRVHKR